MKTDANGVPLTIGCSVCWPERSVLASGRLWVRAFSKEDRPDSVRIDNGDPSNPDLNTNGWSVASWVRPEELLVLRDESAGDRQPTYGQAMDRLRQLAREGRFAEIPDTVIALQNPKDPPLVYRVPALVLTAVMNTLSQREIHSLTEETLDNPTWCESLIDALQTGQGTEFALLVGNLRQRGVDRAKNCTLTLCEFTSTPGPRYRAEGPYSGEEYRQDHLEPAFLQCRDLGGILGVSLDGVWSLPTCFVEEAFGGLVRQYGLGEVCKVLQVRATRTDFPRQVQAAMLRAQA